MKDLHAGTLSFDSLAISEEPADVEPVLDHSPGEWLSVASCSLAVLTLVERKALLTAVFDAAFVVLAAGFLALTVADVDL